MEILGSPWLELKPRGSFPRVSLSPRWKPRVRLFTLSPGDTLTLGSGLSGPESGLLVRAILSDPHKSLTLRCYSCLGKGKGLPGVPPARGSAEMKGAFGLRWGGKA